MRIIPAIDIIDGKCVRLSKGDYATAKIYSEDPIEIAAQFEDHGIESVHIVDLDGAKSQHIVNYRILEEIRRKTKLHIDFGGGLKTNEDLKIAFESGANQVTGGSIAVDNPELFMSWVSQFGSDRIILGADCVNRKIATHGWLEQSEWDVLDYIKMYEQHGITNTICTDVMKDGMLEGPSILLYQEILSNCSTQLIASGGVSCIHDLVELKNIGCHGVIVGKAFYEGRISLNQLRLLC